MCQESTHSTWNKTEKWRTWMSRLGNFPRISDFLIHTNEQANYQLPPSERTIVPLVCRSYCLDHQPCTSDACWATVRMLTTKQKKQKNGKRESGPPDRQTACGARTSYCNAVAAAAPRGQAVDGLAKPLSLSLSSTCQVAFPFLPFLFI
jgi:hypothetical protein